MNDLTKEELLLLIRLSVFGKDRISISAFIELFEMNKEEITELIFILKEKNMIDIVEKDYLIRLFY